MSLELERDSEPSLAFCLLFLLSPFSTLSQGERETQAHHIVSLEDIIRTTCIPSVNVSMLRSTVEPPNKGYVGTGSFVLCREVSFIRRLKCTGIIGIGTSGFVLYREVFFFSECPLSEVPLYTIVVIFSTNDKQLLLVCLSNTQMATLGL